MQSIELMDEASLKDACGVDLKSIIDHTLLKVGTTFKGVKKLCEEAVEHGFYGVCVNPCFVEYAKSMLNGTGVKVCAVAGFPLGSNSAEVKSFEIADATKKGADEIDVVFPLWAFFSGKLDVVNLEMRLLRESAADKVLKVIVESHLLSDEEKAKVLDILIEHKIDFIKTSTGFSGGGATVYDVLLFKKLGGNRIKVKASGGIKNYLQALKLVVAGADRLGTSRSIDIISG